jgi:hypothetical protein
VVGTALDDPLAENLRYDLANPLRAQALVPGDLVIGPALAHAGEDPLGPGGAGDDVKPRARGLSVMHKICRYAFFLEKWNCGTTFGKS